MGRFFWLASGIYESMTKDGEERFASISVFVTANIDILTKEQILRSDITEFGIVALFVGYV